MIIAYGRSSWIKILSNVLRENFQMQNFTLAKINFLPFLSTLDGSRRSDLRKEKDSRNRDSITVKVHWWRKQHSSRRVVNRMDHACTARGHGAPTRRHELSRLGRFQWPEDGLWPVTFLSNRPPPLLSLLLTRRSTLARSNVTPSPSKLDPIY